MFRLLNTHSTLLRGIAIASCALAITGCASSDRMTQFSGETMGTTYHLTYASTKREARYEQQAVAALLENINASMSTYIETSLISSFNRSQDTAAWQPVDRHFETVFQRSAEIYEDTHGTFNPAVGPLVDAWGFGPRDADKTPDDATIKRLLSLASMANFEFRGVPPSIRKRNKEAQLDFSAITKGYAVDAVAELLEQWNVRNYSVEIGGEIKTRGRHPDGHKWRVAIEKPAGDADAPRDLQTTLMLEDAALATSGNYRNYLIEGDRTYGHILDPRTGYPETTAVLSVSVLARDVMTADAYATALMVMGPEEGLRFVESHPNLEAYFMVRTETDQIAVTRSSGFPESVEE